MLMNFKDLGSYRRARVWLDEPPFEAYPARERVERAFPLINYNCFTARGSQTRNSGGIYCCNVR
ncbi:hypothetical protein M2105_001420 [Paenibacillus sp. PastF-1]|nr:hypothetical protein [Paenibacillus sp. PastF-2]MDF9847003.1 hypothetical protein [Paenibacillus sp. PastM-2]MDF9853575.1 hypothetical protein [Paenibacillus sp. PastF-1]MDH6478939.1 hypothetical protein [Paenibacillus sp. PastH-2]MDH6506671.1 hypothetical protein [Paenibacillus sp. PastM-3]